MEIIKCSSCGSIELTQEGEVLTCIYCKSQFKKASLTSETSAGIDEDIMLLLRKCEEDPVNLHQYVNLILDIDPTNPDVLKYLR